LPVHYRPSLIVRGIDDSPLQTLALFCKPTFVDDKRCVGSIPDQLIGIMCHMIKHFTCTPLRVSDKLLQISIIGVRYHLRDRIDVFPRACLHQARNILLGFLVYDEKNRPATKRNKTKLAPTPDSNANHEEQIAQRAYEIWQQRGCVHGNDWCDW